MQLSPYGNLLHAALSTSQWGEGFLKGDGAEDLRVRGAGCAAGAADQTGINLEPVPAKVAALTKPLPLGKLYKIGPQGNRDGWEQPYFIS